MDLIARAAARNAANQAGTAQSRTASLLIERFVDLGQIQIDPAISSFRATGYDTVGRAGGVYVSDSLATAALALAHPRFCKASANGRYFRLVGDADQIDVEQGGAAGVPGTNDQPAIQAAIDYAIAVRIGTVRFVGAAYEVWGTVRTSPVANGPAATDGFPLVVTGDVELRGVRPGTTLNFKGPGGGSRVQTVGASQWMGGALLYKGAAVTRSIIHNLTFNGGLTYKFGDTRAVDLTDKGVLFNDGLVPNLVLVDHRNSGWRNFAGEIWYMGGTFANTVVHVENLVLDGSPQCAWNPGAVATVTAINLQAGNSYQACEVLGGKGHTYIGGRLYDCYSSTMLGGPDPGFMSGYPYSYAIRRTDKGPPWITLNGLRLENVTDALGLGSWVRGSIVVIDAALSLNPSVGSLRDIHLDVEAWCDRKSAYAPVVLSGPATTTLQVPGASAGTYYAPPANIRINITCKRTALAQSTSRYLSEGVRLNAGLYDRNTVAFTVSGEAHKVFGIYGTLPAGFGVPRVDPVGYRTTAQPYGGSYDYPAADKSYDITWSAMVLYPGAACSVTPGGTIAYCDGQKVIFLHGDPSTGKTVTFPPTSSTMRLQADRKLYSKGDMLELRYDQTQARWVEERYLTSTKIVFTGAATWDAPAIAAAATTSYDLAVSGAAVGDQVIACSLDTNLQGLLISANVSAANQVTVTLFNPTQATVDLPSANLAVTVQRR